jgi:hypothetical protein
MWDYELNHGCHIFFWAIVLKFVACQLKYYLSPACGISFVLVNVETGNVPPVKCMI